MESLRMRFILVMMMPTFIGSSLYGMSPSGKEPGVERSASRKRSAPHSGFEIDTSDEETPSLKKPKTTEEENEDFISIPAAAQSDATVRSLNILPPEVLSQVLCHLTSSEGWKLMLTGDAMFRGKLNPQRHIPGTIEETDAWKEMNHVWKAWYVREKNPNAEDFAREITSWKKLFRLTLDLQAVFKTLTFDEVVFFQQLSQMSHPLHLHVQAYLQKNDGKVAEAFELYQRAAEQNFKPAQDVVVEALYSGRFDQVIRSKSVRFDELKKLADKDWEIAQGYVIQALYEGKLGQKVRSAQDRFDDLKAFTDKGWTKAQDYVAYALYEGTIGQEVRSGQKRFDELKALATQGCKQAQYSLTEALYKGTLDQGARPAQGRFEELKAFAAQGWKNAQFFVTKALYEGTLGQDTKTEQDCFDELKTLGERGWKDAQDYVAKALYEGTLEQDIRPKQDCFDELKALATQGCKQAQYSIVEALYKGYLGQDIRPEQERFDELKALGEKCWERAQYYVAEALYYGKLGQNTRSAQDRFDESKVFAAQGWKYAQSYVSQALYGGGGWFDQSNEPGTKRFVELQTLAAKGHEGSQDRVHWAIEHNKLDQIKDEETLKRLRRVQKLLQFFAPQ